MAFTDCSNILTVTHSLTTPLVTPAMKDLDSLMVANGTSSLRGSLAFAVLQFIPPLLSLGKRSLPEERGNELPSLTLSQVSTLIMEYYP